VALAPVWTIQMPWVRSIGYMTVQDKVLIQLFANHFHCLTLASRWG
jgi:hypothetical protein